MIASFRHKGLQRFFNQSDKRGIPAQHAARITRVLDRLDAIKEPEDMNVPGYRFHELKGARAGTYAVDVSGNLRLTFSFNGADVTHTDLEDYH